MNRKRFLGVLLGLLLCTVSAQTWAKPVPQPSPSVIALSPSEKAGFWASPIAPAGFSLLLPGSGQIYQSFGPEQDWFAFGRGVLYLGGVGLGLWQLIASMNRQDTGGAALWGGVLIGINILSPVDAFVTASLKNAAAEEKRVQAELAEKARLESYKKLYEAAFHLAQEKKYEQAISKIKEIPGTAPQAKLVSGKIKQWEQDLAKEKADLQAQQRYDEAFAMAKAGNFTPAIELALQVSNGTAVYEQAQKKAKEWQLILDERAARILFNEAIKLAEKGKWAEAIQKAKQVPAHTSWGTKAKQKAEEWTKHLTAKKTP